MSKAVKKKGRKIWKTIRKTLGTLFLVSALVVAAIPVDNLQAVNGTSTLALDSDGRDDMYSYRPGCRVPSIADYTTTHNNTSPQIYVDQGQNLEFVYIQVDEGWRVIITKYNGGFVENGTLTIPDAVSAYKQYDPNVQSGYAAVGRSGNFLFYRLTEEHTYTEVPAASLDNASALSSLVTTHYSTNKYVRQVSAVERMTTDNDGNPIGSGYYTVVLEEETGDYLPCYSTQIDAWGNLSVSRIYYDSDHPNGTAVKPGETSGMPSTVEPTNPAFKSVQGLEEFQQIKDAIVSYITKEYQGADDKWVTIDDEHAENGVFARETNFSNVVLGKNLKGVGNYAFYGTGVTSMTFTNSLTTIGEGAFQGCTRLASVALVTEGDTETNLKEICASAFQDCTALTRFDVPWSVTHIGDAAFSGCTALTQIQLCNTGSLLEYVGLDVFRGCSRLQSLTFPERCKGPLYLSTFAGCTALSFICARSSDMYFMDDNLVTYASFKNAVSSQFYFEGQEGSALQEMCRGENPDASCNHNECKDIFFAFSYIDSSYVQEGLYELTTKDPMSADGKNIFVVTNQNELSQYIPKGNVTSLTIPANIGPYSINTIRGRDSSGNEGAFANLCNLQAVVIPSTVKAIGDYAFVGCHNLTSVIFDGFNMGTDNITIGTNAFQTQNWTKYGGHTCDNNGVETVNGEPKNKLVFVGPISADFGPFNYAMSAAGAYNNNSQGTSYITYYTGWPYNLKVEYDADNDRSELKDFPSLSELAEYAGTEDAPGPLYYYYNSITANADYLDAMKNANNDYAIAGGNVSSLTPNERTVIDAALNVVIPDGVESIRDGLFYDKGVANEKEMTVTAYSSLEEIRSGTYGYDETTGSGNSVGTHYDGLKPGTGTFAGCEWLTGVNLWPGSNGIGTEIGDYAFQDCVNLVQVSIDDNSDLGIGPFYGCDKLTDVNFGSDATHYTCKDSIIYTADNNGDFTVIVECLGGKTGYIEPGDLAGVTALWDAAFKGSNVEQIDLARTTITTIPAETFADTPGLRRLLFPSTLTTIREKAFEGSGVNYIFASNASNSLIPAYISQTAFDGLVKVNGGDIEPRTDYSEVTWVCEEGTRGEEIGIEEGFAIRYATGESIWTVNFYDWSSSWNQDTLVDSVSVVSEGYVLDLPEPNGRPGMVFAGWKVQGSGDTFTNRYPVVQNLEVYATYEVAPSDYGKVTVTFLDDDGTLISRVTVEPGTDMTTHDVYKYLIPSPSRDGYVFLGWDRELTNITGDLEVRAQYRTLIEGECLVRYIVDGNVIFQQVVIAGSQAIPITPPTIEGKTFVQWAPEPGIVTGNTDYIGIYVDGNGNTNDPNNPNGPGNGTGSGNGTNNPTGSGNTVSVYHTLTVQGGSGSGSYIAGTQVIINANAPARGQVFNGWTISPADTVVTDKSLASAIITMPNNDVAAIANYKAGSSSSSGSGSGNTASSNRPTNTAQNVGGTSVVIDKNGLSNTGVVSATVNGSSDNFVVKVTESSSATEAVLKALQAEYGSLDNIKYFPMDISLYDSTGTRKITDTTGLSVDITLPLPDSLIAYAGNNKVAGVVNDRLDKLTPKFTTINGVACVTFTAEHFSPYVIYVDIANLSDGTIADRTPTTGDGIHPKWFLSIGLASLSFVMFMWRDSRKGAKKKQKVPVKVRAK